MSRLNKTFVDFDGTLVLENSSRILMETLMEHATTKPERLTARALGGSLQRVFRVALGVVSRVTGDRDLALVLVLWAFRETFVANGDEIIADVAHKLTLNGSLEDVYAEPFSIASAGLRPVIEAFLQRYPHLPVIKVYASELLVDGAKLRLKLLTMRGKLRALLRDDTRSYFTDYDREARMYGRRVPGGVVVRVVPGQHSNTIFHLKGKK